MKENDINDNRIGEREEKKKNELSGNLVSSEVVDINSLFSSVMFSAFGIVE